MNLSLDPAGRDLPDAPAPRLAGPLLFSVALHGAVLLLFARALFAPEASEKPADETPSIQVALVVRPSRPIAPVAAEAEQVEDADATQEVDPVEPEATLAEAAQQAEPGLESATPTPAAPPAVADIPAAPGATDSPEDPATDAPWTPARIRAAVQGTTTITRSSVTTAWMEDCLREQKQRGVGDCDSQREEQDHYSANAAAGRAAGIGAFASVTRADQQWLLAEGFKKNNETLRGLLDAEGVVGELAYARYFLNRDYIIYLSGNRVNGNHNDMTFFAMQNFTADVLAGPRLVVNGDTPFQCRSKKVVEYGVDLTTARVTGGNIVPCIYDYTGFNIERPETAPDPNAFRVVPQIFGSQR